LKGPPPQQQQQELATQSEGTGFVPPPPPPEAPAPPPRSPTPERARRHYDDDDTISGKAPLPTKFNGNRDALGGWILQLEEYFIITGVQNERQKMAFIGLYLEGKALDWWKANKNKVETWQEARDGLALYYGYHYKPDRSYQELLALKQTGTVQDYLTEVDRLNSHACIPDRQLINIMISNLSNARRMAMAYYENLRDTSPQWRQKLIEMDIISKEFQTRATAPPHNNNTTRIGRRGRSVHLRIVYISEEDQREAEI